MLLSKSYKAIFLIFLNYSLYHEQNKLLYLLYLYGYSSKRPCYGFTCTHIQNWKNWLFYLRILYIVIYCDQRFGWDFKRFQIKKKIYFSNPDKDLDPGTVFK
jgi:hypothetical protein